MYNPQETAERIRVLCSANNVSENKMLQASDAGVRTLQNMKTSMPSCDKIAKIADYFNVSVDYLLGRTDNPEINR
ncbi:MAG: helix-turn-helix transcriptional regulator [bacterium]|nr:helix-turn-helix transcriptional regulator [bacterium]